MMDSVKERFTATIDEIREAGLVSEYSIVRMCSQAGDVAEKGRPSQDGSDTVNGIDRRIDA